MGTVRPGPFKKAEIPPIAQAQCKSVVFSFEAKGE